MNPEEAQANPAVENAERMNLNGEGRPESLEKTAENVREAAESATQGIKQAIAEADLPPDLERQAEAEAKTAINEISAIEQIESVFSQVETEARITREFSNELVGKINSILLSEIEKKADNQKTQTKFRHRIVDWNRNVEEILASNRKEKKKIEFIRSSFKATFPELINWPVSEVEVIEPADLPAGKTEMNHEQASGSVDLWTAERLVSLSDDDFTKLYDLMVGGENAVLLKDDIGGKQIEFRQRLINENERRNQQSQKEALDNFVGDSVSVDTNKSLDSLETLGADQGKDGAPKPIPEKKSELSGESTKIFTADKLADLADDDFSKLYHLMIGAENSVLWGEHLTEEQQAFRGRLIREMGRRKNSLSEIKQPPKEGLKIISTEELHDLSDQEKEKKQELSEKSVENLPSKEELSRLADDEFTALYHRVLGSHDAEYFKQESRSPEEVAYFGRLMYENGQRRAKQREIKQSPKPAEVFLTGEALKGLTDEEFEQVYQNMVNDQTSELTPAMVEYRGRVILESQNRNNKQTKLAEENKNELSENEKIGLIREASTFDQLYAVLDKIGEVVGSQKNYSPIELKILIHQARYGFSERSRITRSLGLRDKVTELMKHEEHSEDLVDQEKIDKLRVLLDKLNVAFNSNANRPAKKNVLAEAAEVLQYPDFALAVTGQEINQAIEKATAMAEEKIRELELSRQQQPEKQVEKDPIKEEILQLRQLLTALDKSSASGASREDKKNALATAAEVLGHFPFSLAMTESEIYNATEQAAAMAEKRLRQLEDIGQPDKPLSGEQRGAIIDDVQIAYTEYPDGSRQIDKIISKEPLPYQNLLVDDWKYKMNQFGQEAPGGQSAQKTILETDTRSLYAKHLMLKNIFIPAAERVAMAKDVLNSIHQIKDIYGDVLKADMENEMNLFIKENGQQKVETENSPKNSESQPEVKSAKKEGEIHPTEDESKEKTSEALSQEKIIKAVLQNNWTELVKQKGADEQAIEQIKAQVEAMYHDYRDLLKLHQEYDAQERSVLAGQVTKTMVEIQQRYGNIIRDDFFTDERVLGRAKNWLNRKLDKWASKKILKSTDRSTKDENISEVQKESQPEVQPEKNKITMSSAEIKDIIYDEIGDKANIEKLELIATANGLSLSADINAGIMGGKISLKCGLVNKGKEIELAGLKIDARGYVKKMIEKNVSGFAPAIREYLEKQHGKQVSSIQIKGTNLEVEFAD